MDYTTAALVEAYIASAVPIPSKDIDLIQHLITNVSAQVDVFCQQTLGQKTYTNFSVQATVNRDGGLEMYIPAPVVQSISNFSYLIPNTNTPYSIPDVSSILIDNRRSGTRLNLVNYNFAEYRRAGSGLRCLISFVGGYNPLDGGNPADPYILPNDIEQATTRLVQWFYQKRNAPMEQIAGDGTGSVYISNYWPADVKDVLKFYRRAMY